MEKSKKILSTLFVSMLRIRRVEEAIARHYGEWQMRCPIHLCVGQEAVSAGVCAALNRADAVFSNHRAHGHYLAKGGNLKAFIAELYGRADGCAGGIGGSMHLTDQNVNFLGSTPIVGGTLPLSVGAAWANLLRKKKTIVATFFGDGCFEEGVVHECLNFAALKKVPVLFICENNGYSVCTPLEDRQPKRKIYKVAAAHGWNARCGAGDDALEVYSMTKHAVDLIRKGSGPQFLEFSTHRWSEHCGPNEDNHLSYRKKDELGAWKKSCPIERLRKLLLEKNILNERGLKSIDKKIEMQIKSAFDFSIKNKAPRFGALADKIYAR